MSRLLTIPLAVLCLACQASPEPRDPILARILYQRTLAAVAELPRCGDAARAGADWPRNDHRFFSFQLPPEYSQSQTRGIDSYVRSFEAPGRSFSLNFGQHSASLSRSETSGREYRACRATVDGRMVRLMTARATDGAYFAGAAWRDLEPGLHLSVFVRSETAAGQEEALAIFRSIDFREPLGGR